MTDSFKPRRLGDLADTLHRLAIETNRAVAHVIRAIPNERPRVHEAEWHLRGLVYHGMKVLRSYEVVAEEALRRLDLGADVAIMRAPAVQPMYFELYALVNLCRIALDRLRDVLAPTFVTPYGSLPKSINRFLAGWTDCPLFHGLATDPIFRYLIDLRDCIVHYRTFATNDIVLVAEADAEFPEEPFEQLGSSAMARCYYRRHGERLVINFFLPDRIFADPESRHLAKFTYHDRISLAGQAVRFVELAATTTWEAMAVLMLVREPRFIWQRRPP